MPPQSPITIHGRPLRMLWQCNAPHTPGGYGQQTALILPRLRDRLGVEVGLFANFGLMGGKLNWDGIPIYPTATDPFGNDVAAAHAKTFKADMLLTHQDVWTQRPAQLTQNGTRWVSWPPLDSEPVAPQIAMRLEETYQTIALSKFGQIQAQAAGLDVKLITQGIDTNVFTPSDRIAARKALGWPLDAFLVGMVAMNKGYPSRKAFGPQLEAFARFAQQHDDAMIYIHTFGHPTAGDREATPIEWHLRRHGLEKRAIWAHPYDLLIGHSVEDMVTRYRAFDVLLSVSMSEGFGLPIIEAQSCGIPVITGDWTAMSEITYAGWSVAYDDSEPFYVEPLECEWRQPHVGAITDKLEAAYSALQSDTIRGGLAERGREHIIARHDQDLLIDTAWHDTLSDLARRIEDEIVPFHRHKWQNLGQKDSAGVVTRCQVEGCPAELRVAQDGTRTTYDRAAPIAIGSVLLDIDDHSKGGVARQIAYDVIETYKLDQLRLLPGAVIIDVGAHVGVVSCYLSKRFPESRIIAVEPVPTNFARLQRNLAANGCANVTPLNCAITADGRDVVLSGDPTVNTGHYSAWDSGPDTWTVHSRTLADILKEQSADRIALLKLDCEGAEYEILGNLDLSRIGTLVMEVHTNRALFQRYDRPGLLIDRARHQIARVIATAIEIGDSEEVAV